PSAHPRRAGARARRGDGAAAAAASRRADVHRVRFPGLRGQRLDRPRHHGRHAARGRRPARGRDAQRARRGRGRRAPRESGSHRPLHGCARVQRVLRRRDGALRARHPAVRREDRVSPKHTIADHLLGQEHGHSHEGADADHDHEHFDETLPLEENPIWIQDHVTLASVGIDIGSSGTQVIFSRLALRRHGEALTSRYVVVSRETLFESPVALTPYGEDDRIDAAKLGAIMDQAYAQAGVQPADIDTGVVILTGEALRRENSGAIAAVIANRGGDLVCASAGHHMEAMLAAFGSGAAQASQDRGARLLNIDIGGGTTKLAIVEHGRVLATAALHIGGRLRSMDETGRIVRLEPAGEAHAAAAGCTWKRGDMTIPAGLDRVADTMASALLDSLLHGRKDLYLTEPLPSLEGVAGVMFSGGVAEYVYERESRDFADLGKRLGACIRTRIRELPWPLLPAGECIRATALGASEYSVQLSGN